MRDLDLDQDQDQDQERKQEQGASSSMTSAVDSGAWHTTPMGPGAAAAAGRGPCAHTRQLYRRSGRPATP
ncbi:hypothetical protein IQ62_23965 [Streptomyces scabiei]|nr:hypothetical protein IQ62_23965 [Streptomyces scabiei]